MPSTTTKSRRPTLRDVAREAGVSYQTVSRVINDSSNVSGSTRDKILDTIKRLGYRPNRAAQILQTERSHTIEVIMFYFGFNRFLYGMATAAHQHGYHFVISTISEDEFQSTLENAVSRFVDGLILVPLIPVIEDYGELLRLTDGVPFVQIGAKLGAEFPSVIYDQFQGAKLATQHLIDLGHRHIVEISGPLQNFDGHDRHEGWIATMKENGLPLGASLEGGFEIEGGYRAMKQLLDSGEQFTAAFIANDSMAFGAYTALRERGLRVPEDVSIVGFDDLPESAHFTPGLTTVRQDFLLLGQLAIEYVISMINNPDLPVHQRVLTPKLIVRNSTAPIR